MRGFESGCFVILVVEGSLERIRRYRVKEREREAESERGKLVKILSSLFCFIILFLYTLDMIYHDISERRGEFSLECQTKK